MKKIILANIGNRNLTYQGKPLLPDHRFPEIQMSFRERTLDLLNRFDTIQSELNEQILSVLLDDITPENVEKVVLFASNNQIDGDRNDQDTIHEAHILQRLFAERLGLTVDVVEYTRNVTHNDELLRFYRDELRRYQTSNFPLIICDAGGTAQQKSALKIAAEYLLNPSHFSVRYVLPSGKLTTVDQVEYRRIIDEEQVAALVQYGQYAAALTIYNQSISPNKNALQLLKFLAKRSDLFYGDAQQEITPDLKIQSDFFADFKGGRPIGDIGPFKEALSPKSFFALCERLEIAHYRYSLGDWSRSILGLSIFLESLVNAVINRISPFKLEEAYFSNATMLLTEVKEGDHDDIRSFFPSELKMGLPLHLKYAGKMTTGLVNSLLKIFESLNSWTNGSGGKRGMDCLRNDIAHKGRSVKEIDLQKQTPEISQVFKLARQLLGFPSENTYTTLNQLFLELLRQ